MKIFFFAILTTLFIVSFGKEPHELKPWEMFGKTEQPGNELKPWEKFAKAKKSNFYAPRAFERERLYKAFAGDPLAVLDDNLRPEMEFYANREENPDEVRKRVALAAYFSMMDKKKFSFALENLDTHLKRYYAYTGRDVSVTEAYYDIARMLHPDEFFFYEEYGPVILRISAWICLPTTACLLLWFLIKRRKTIKNWIVQKMKTTHPFLLCSLILTELLLAISIMTVVLGKSLPIGFYTFLRICVCALAACRAWTLHIPRPVCSFVLAAFAVLYNPVVPIHLGDRSIWMILNIVILIFLPLSWIRKK